MFPVAQIGDQGSGTPGATRPSRHRDPAWVWAPTRTCAEATRPGRPYAAPQGSARAKRKPAPTVRPGRGRFALFDRLRAPRATSRGERQTRDAAFDRARPRRPTPCARTAVFMGQGEPRLMTQYSDKSAGARVEAAILSRRPGRAPRSSAAPRAGKASSRCRDFRIGASGWPYSRWIDRTGCAREIAARARRFPCRRRPARSEGLLARHPGPPARSRLAAAWRRGPVGPMPRRRDLPEQSVNLPRPCGPGGAALRSSTGSERPEQRRGASGRPETRRSIGRGRDDRRRARELRYSWARVSPGS